jgi:peptidoglycan/LPS O-acetylase OafA/YrhL
VAGMSGRTTGRRHLDAVDVVRALTIALVIGVHTLSTLPQATDVSTGAFVIAFHVSREVFLFLTALVLIHVYGRRPVRWTVFWRRRYLCVAVPYATWTVVYLLLDGQRLDPLSTFLAALAHDLISGASRYHLYFLLVTMQIYLCFPLLRWLLRVTRRHHGILLAICVVYQLVFSLAVHERWPAPGIVGAWLRTPDAALPSYLLYVVAGGVAAWHLEALIAGIRRHHRALLLAGALSIVAGITVYLEQVARGVLPQTASAVFQPIVVVETAGVVAAFFSLGVMWADRGRPARRLITDVSDASFGIYLAHPLLLEGLAAIVLSARLQTAVAGLPVMLALALALVVLTPALYASTAVLAMLARRTPLSLPLTGRRQGAGHVVDAAPLAVGASSPARARAA